MLVVSPARRCRRLFHPSCRPTNARYTYMMVAQGDGDLKRPARVSKAATKRTTIALLWYVVIPLVMSLRAVKENKTHKDTPPYAARQRHIVPMSRHGRLRGNAP